MNNTWAILLPPVVVLIGTFITKRLNSSLCAGIILAALITTNWSALPAFKLSVFRLKEIVTDFDNIYTYCFLLVIGALVLFIERTGGANAFARIITRRITSTRSAQNSSLLISFSLFIDDYLNILTSSAVMRSITDQTGVPRAKLAYLIHSLSSPLVVLAPISSWTGMLITQFESAGISMDAHLNTKIYADPFLTYLSTIPYLFYSFALIMSVWLIVHYSYSFGPMKIHEDHARNTGNLFAGKEPQAAISDSTAGNLLDFVVPVCSLLIFVFMGIAYSGGYHLLGGTVDLVSSFKNNTQTPAILALSAGAAFALSCVRAWIAGTLTIADIKNISKDGILLMYKTVVMLILASTLGLIFRLDLQAGTYLSNLIGPHISLHLLPVMFFLISCIISFITGTAWGTIALLAPIVIQLLIGLEHVATPTTIEHIPLLIPILGSLLSGSVCGNQLTPISDTTIMTCSGTGAYLTDHLITQAWYVLPVIIGSLCGFYITGLTYTSGYVLCALYGLTTTCIATWLCIVLINSISKGHTS